MQSPTKSSSKVSSKQGTPQKQQKSYLDIYKNRNSSNRPSKKATSTFLIPKDQALLNRSGYIVEHINRGGDVSTIKIQEQQEQAQIMRNQYLETQLLMLRKIDQIRHAISEVKSQCETEQRIISQMEEELTAKRLKNHKLNEQLSKVRQENKYIEVDTYEQQTNMLQKQYNQLQEDYLALQSVAISKRNSQLQKNKALNGQIDELKKQISELSQYESEKYNANLRNSLSEQENLTKQITEMEENISLMLESIRQLQNKRPMREDTHRKYLQFYEKIHINKQLDKMQNLILRKQGEIERLERYQNLKKDIKEINNEISEKEKKMTDLKGVRDLLQQDIRDKSTILLQLYQNQR